MSKFQFLEAEFSKLVLAAKETESLCILFKK